MAGSLLTAKVTLELDGTDKVKAQMIAETKAGAAAAGKVSGAEFGNAFSRDVNGRLHDLRGRFIAEGNASGKGFSRGFSTNVDSVFKKLGSIGGPSGGVTALLGGLTALAPAVVGISAAVLPAAAGIAGALVSAGAGAAAFAVVAVPAFKKVQTASKALSTAQNQLALATTKAQRASAIKAETKALQGLSGPEKEAVKNYSAFTAAVTNFQHKLEPKIFPVIAGGFKDITAALPLLEPLINGASDAFLNLEKKAGQALKDPFWTNFTQFLGGSAKTSITTFGQVAGNVFTGFAGLIQGLNPQVLIAQQGLLGISKSFAGFGKQVAAGTSEGFKSFISFTTGLGPQVKATLAGVGGLVAAAFSGIGPAIKPSLVLLQDLSRALTPVVGALSSQLPGIITSIDGLVQKAAPLAKALAGPFSQGVAEAIKGVASGLGTVADELNRLPPGVVKAIGEALGILVGAAAISKVTGLAKLATYISGIGAASAVAAPEVTALATAEAELTTASAGGGKAAGAAAGITVLGGSAEKATGKLAGLRGVISGLGRLVIPAAIGVQIGVIIGKSGPVEKLATGFENLRNKAEGLPGPLGAAARGFNSFDNVIAGLAGNVRTVSQQVGTFAGIVQAKLPSGKTVTIKVGGAETFKKALADAQAIAKGLPTERILKLLSKDDASAVIKEVGKKAAAYGALTPTAHLDAADKASVTIGSVAAKAGKYGALTPTAHLGAADHASSIIGGVSAAARAVPDATVHIGAVDGASGTIGAVAGELGSLNGRTATTYIDTVYRTVGRVGGLGSARASGGWAQGPGGPTSDSFLQPTSNGEFTVNAKAAKANAALLEAINSGQFASAGQGSSSAGIAQAAPAPIVVKVMIDKREIARAVTNGQKANANRGQV